MILFPIAKPFDKAKYYMDALTVLSIWDTDDSVVVEQ